MQLKLYAKEEFQTSKMGYTDKEKGYIYNIFDYNWTLTLTTIIVTVTTLCASIKLLQKLLSIKSKQEEIKTTFFFAFVSVVSLINLVDMGIQVFELHYGFISEEKYKATSSDIKEILTATRYHKLVETILGMLIFLIGGMTMQILACVKPIPEPTRRVTIYLCIPNCFFCCCKHFFYFGNFFYFTYTLGLNIVATFIMLFITPIETISVVIFFGTMLLSAIMGIIALELYVKKTSERKINRKCAQYSLLAYYTCQVYLL